MGAGKSYERCSDRTGQTTRPNCLTCPTNHGSCFVLTAESRRSVLARVSAQHCLGSAQAPFTWGLPHACFFPRQKNPKRAGVPQKGHAPERGAKRQIDSIEGEWQRGPGQRARVKSVGASRSRWEVRHSEWTPGVHPSTLDSSLCVLGQQRKAVAVFGTSVRSVYQLQNSPTERGVPPQMIGASRLR